MLRPLTSNPLSWEGTWYGSLKREAATVTQIAVQLIALTLTLGAMFQCSWHTLVTFIASSERCTTVFQSNSLS